LIHQRHLTPSCGGHAPTAERTLYPARMFAESLTPRPELENDQDPTETLAAKFAVMHNAAFLGSCGMVRSPVEESTHETA